MTSSARMTFQGTAGQHLAARIERPSGLVRGQALFAHCFTCSKESLAAARISSALAERGFAVLRFDFTGLGGSGGDFANTSFSTNVEDLVAAAQALREAESPPELLIGHSLGGAAVLAAAGSIPEVKAVATIGAPAEPAHVAHLFDAAEIERHGAAEVSIGGRRFTIGKQFLDDIAGSRLESAVAGLGKPLTIFHAPRDEIVGIDNARRIFEWARHPKSFVSLEGADHLLTGREDSEFVAEVLAAMATRYLGSPAAQVESPEPGEGEVLVQETGKGRFQNLIAAGRHRLLADEPVSVGGLDSGLSPYELLTAGLGACTSMTLRMYAERKGLPLERVSVRLHHEKIHAEDCAECETRTGKVDRIERFIALEGDLDADQRKRLLEIADMCPVHRSLEREVKVATRLEED